MNAAFRLLLILVLLGIPRLGLAFPQVAATNTSAQTSNTTSHTVNLPAGIVAGDLLIVLFSHDGPQGWSFPGGWTTPTPWQDNAGQFSSAMAYRIADASEGASITVTTANTERSAHQSFRINSWQGSTPPEFAPMDFGVTTTPDPESLTPSWGGGSTLWIVAGIGDADAVFSADPTGYDNVLENDSGGTTAGVKIRTLRRSASVATENPSAFTATNRIYTVYTIGVRGLPDFTGRRAFRGGP
jgi:hypothetical protein